MSKAVKKSAGSGKLSKPTLLKKGDKVMVIAGGNKESRALKGQTGKILRFVGENRQKAVVEGLNLVTRHTRAKAMGQKSGKVVKEAPIHVSRLMYSADKINKPVKLCCSCLEDGRKVRGYKEKGSRNFVQLVD